jgi:hypothetical protein
LSPPGQAFYHRLAKPFVIARLVRAIHLQGGNARPLDGPVKPGHDNMV